MKDKDTGKPIAGATVVVRRTSPTTQNGSHRIIEETRHTTNAEGVYSFTIPPEQVAEKRLYIELDVEHPDYATQAGFGYALAHDPQGRGQGRAAVLRERSRSGRPSRSLGRVETPDGKPLGGVEIVAYSLTRKVKEGPREHGSFARVKTDRDGRFRIPITTPAWACSGSCPRTLPRRCTRSPTIGAAISGRSP